jgi:hypothetical protein
VSVEPKPTAYVTEDLLAWQEQGTLILSPKFQRRSVWKPAAKSYFIDTLLRGFPVPPLHIRMVRDPRRGLVREVVDGQQRLRAVFDFIAGKQRLSGQLDAPWSGASYQTLSEAEQNTLRDYSFPVYQYTNVSDELILEIFARINTYSVALNAQELRNGKYFGTFKRTVYALGLEYLNFWRDTKIFTEGAIARMQEAELVSELLILQMDGLQDKKNSINEFYSHLDDQWGVDPLYWTTRGAARPAAWLPEQESLHRFRNTVSSVVEIAGDILSDSEFNRVPLFYTLYAVVYHHLYGLPRTVDIPSPTRPFRKAEAITLREVVGELSALVSEKPDDEELASWQRDFLVASARQTDNLAPRQTRFETIWRRAGLHS